MRWVKIVTSGVTPFSCPKWKEEYETIVCKLKADLISTKMAPGQMKEQHKQEIFDTFKALPKEKRKAFTKKLKGEQYAGGLVKGKQQQSGNEHEDEDEGAI